LVISEAFSGFKLQYFIDFCPFPKIFVCDLLLEKQFSGFDFLVIPEAFSGLNLPFRHCSITLRLVP
jgi:hypothetical protein